MKTFKGSSSQQYVTAMCILTVGAEETNSHDMGGSWSKTDSVRPHQQNELFISMYNNDKLMQGCYATSQRLLTII